MHLIEWCYSVKLLFQDCLFWYYQLIEFSPELSQGPYNSHNLLLINFMMHQDIIYTFIIVVFEPGVQDNLPQHLIIFTLLVLLKCLPAFIQNFKDL